MMHFIEHILGLCGEKHPSIIALMMEHQAVTNLINYIKVMYGRII